MIEAKDNSQRMLVRLMVLMVIGMWIGAAMLFAAIAFGCFSATDSRASETTETTTATEAEQLPTPYALAANVVRAYQRLDSLRMEVEINEFLDETPDDVRTVAVSATMTPERIIARFDPPNDAAACSDVSHLFDRSWIGDDGLAYKHLHEHIANGAVTDGGDHFLVDRSILWDDGKTSLIRLRIDKMSGLVDSWHMRHIDQHGRYVWRLLEIRNSVHP